MKKREVAASVGQRLLWLLKEYRGGEGALSCPVVCRVDGPLDLARLESALAQLVARHESLRTTFARRGRVLRQIIHEPGPVRLVVAELPEPGASADPTERWRAAVREEIRTAIDPTVWPSRFTLWRIAEGSHVLCLNLHHLVTDTWSCLVLQRHLARAYGGESLARDHGRPAPWQFSQVTAWQQRQLDGQTAGRHREYWQRQLAGAVSARLPIGPRRPGPTGPRGTIEATLGAAAFRGLRALATRRSATLFSVGLAAFFALIARRTGQDDLAVATLFANRTRPEVEDTVGFLTNLVVLRVRLGGASTFSEVIDRTRAVALDGLAHQVFPFHLASSGAPTGVGLDDVVFQMLAEPIEEAVVAAGVTFTGVVPEVPGRFDFELAVMPRGDELALKLYYTESRVDRKWAAQLLADYVVLASAVAAAPDAPLTGIAHFANDDDSHRPRLDPPPKSVNN